MKIKTLPKIKQSDHIFALKIKTESNSLGVLKSFIVLLLIFLQAALLILSYLYILYGFQWYILFSFICTVVCCIYVLSSDYHGQAKATWVFFLLACSSFAYIIYFMSDKHILFSNSKKKYSNILLMTNCLQKQLDLNQIQDLKTKSNCTYLYDAGQFVAHNSSKTKYFPSGAQIFDSILEDLKKAKEFIFIEFFIISDGVLLKRFLDVLKVKSSEGVDIRIIYDDMGSHKTLKRRTKKLITSYGIKLQCFNRLVPIFNIALNLRDHRKLIIIDGKVSYTGGVNLADEYINEKRMHGYWKDSGIRVEGTATDNFTIAFLTQWKFLTKEGIEWKNYINKAKKFECDGVVVPFVSGPNYSYSISQNMYTNLISNAEKSIYIMTPYFIPDETLMNLLINKARSGVDVRIILPEVADKRFVYIVSRNNAEKLIKFGVKVYTMTSSFVHSKIVLTDNSAIVGSINMDLRSFNQQFESAVYISDSSTINEIEYDFANVFNYSKQILDNTCWRKSKWYRMLACLLNIISPFM